MSSILIRVNRNFPSSRDTVCSETMSVNNSGGKTLPGHHGDRLQAFRGCVRAHQHRRSSLIFLFLSHRVHRLRIPRCLLLFLYLYLSIVWLEKNENKSENEFSYMKHIYFCRSYILIFYKIIPLCIMYWLYYIIIHIYSIK